MLFGISKKIVTFHNSVLFCSWIYDWCLFKQCECQITEFFHLLLPFFSTTKCHFFDHLQLAAGKSLAETTEPKGSCHFQMEENKNLKETRGKRDGRRRSTSVNIPKHIFTLVSSLACNVQQILFSKCNYSPFQKGILCKMRHRHDTHMYMNQFHRKTVTVILEVIGSLFMLFLFGRTVVVSLQANSDSWFTTKKSKRTHKLPTSRFFQKQFA